jgi:hypothetical protein
MRWAFMTQEKRELLLSDRPFSPMCAKRIMY